MNREKMAAFLGAMLHDIGKLMQRAELEKEFPEIRNYYEEFCPTPTSYLHAAHSAFFVERFLPENMIDKEMKRILYDACRHHCGVSSPGIFQLSDWISSGMDRSDIKMETGGYKDTPLYPVFDRIELSYSILDNNGKFAPRWYYPLSKLSISGEIFPQHIPESDKGTHPENRLVPDYRQLWKEFTSELDELNRSQSYGGWYYFNELFYLLHRYTWCIPSATNVLPDISLFDHLKTSAAIAGCLFDCHQYKALDNKEFLLFGADLSGIQLFIFQIAGAQGIGGVSKRLRGRSFYLMMLMEIFSRYIIHKLDLTLANINFCGGGNMELLLPHTENTLNFLKVFDSDVNQWLLNKFCGQISLVSDYVPLSKNDLKEHFPSFKDQLQDALALKKRRKFKDFLDDPDFLIRKDNPACSPLRICPSCRLSVIEKDDDIICPDCQNHKEAGEALPGTRMLVFSLEDSEQLQEKDSERFSYGKFGAVYLCKSLNIDTLTYGQGYVEAVKVDQSYDAGKGFYFLSNVLPVAAKAMILETEKDPDGTSDEKEGLVRKGQTLSFTTLADMSTGDARIGILKLDVDNLGLIFSLGLEPSGVAQGNSGKFRSISRCSALSRELTYFFNGIVNTACYRISDKWKQETDWKEKQHISGVFYIVFSGGDDSVIIGPWDRIIELACEIRRLFKDFTCHNPNLSISGGIFICKPKYPISLAARKAEEALKRSKEKGKNRITVFGETVVWDAEDRNLSRIFDKSVKDRYMSYETNEVCRETIFKPDDNKPSYETTVPVSRLLNLEQLLIQLYSSEKIPRRFVHQLIQGKHTYFPVIYNYRWEREEEHQNKMILPYLFYIMRRNLDAETFQKLWQEIINGGDAAPLLRQIRIPASMFLLKTRQN